MLPSSITCSTSTRPKSSSEPDSKVSVVMLPSCTYSITIHFLPYFCYHDKLLPSGFLRQNMYSGLYQRSRCFNKYLNNFTSFLPLAFYPALMYHLFHQHTTT